jgi:glycerol-3-phosphate dehydrogenase
LKTPIESYINPKALEAFHNAVSEFVSNPDMFGKTLVGSTREVFSEIFSEGVVNALKKYKDTLAKYSKFGGQLALLVEGVDLGGQVANIFALALGIANMQNAGEKAEMLIINDV